MARFFIDRPVFAWVLAIMAMLAGLLAIFSLPVSMYPQIAPPVISVSCTYAGASSATLENTVTQVLEQQMQGLDGLMYLSATSNASGSVRMQLTFEPSVNPDIAQTQVMNKVQLCMSNLPESVQKAGVKVDKTSSAFMCQYAFVSEDGSMNSSDIVDYVGTYVSDTLARVPGVGGVRLYGAKHAVRIWLDPDKMAAYALSPGDIKSAVQAQNAQVSAGQLGALPQEEDAAYNVVVTAQERMRTPGEFAAVILRTNADGSVLRLSDVARVEMGAERYDTMTRYNGIDAAGLSINLASGANALETMERLDRKIEQLRPNFPKGMACHLVFDTTPFVRASIRGVVKTLAEAIGLVFIVLLVFLGSIRATIIPTLAVPVVLLGTFAVISTAGCSLNSLTLFGMVLSIGLLVDDAIVVVENVERLMAEGQPDPREATRRTMDQITSAVMGIAVVLAAVFLPMAFFGGSVGVIYRQFSITIVTSMTLSVATAVVFTPALCASVLKQRACGKMRGFDLAFLRFTDAYARHVRAWMRHPVPAAAAWLIIAAGMVVLFRILPTGFLPTEDMGRLQVSYILPQGSTSPMTLEVLKKVERYFLNEEKESVDRMSLNIGFSYSGEGQNVGQGFITLKDWSERGAPSQRAAEIARRANSHFAGMREARIMVTLPPSINGLGTSAGFDLQLEDRAGLGPDELMKARNELLSKAKKSPVLASVRANATEDAPQLRMRVDREKAGMLGVSLADANEIMSTAWGGSYFDSFLDKDRIKRVYMQGDAPFRMNAEDLGRWHVRNRNGGMVPISAFAQCSWTFGPTLLERFNAFPSKNIQGQPAPGMSSGDAMRELERFCSELPEGIGYEWSGLSYQEKQSGAKAGPLYAVSLLVVFLALAALYESWAVPLAVLFIMPVGIFGTLFAAYARGMSNDIFFQVAILTTMGLAAKNAILIVEFALSLAHGGLAIADAVAKACELRLRPIVMTSLAFMLGVLPLAISTGAGSGSQNSIGTGILGGTLVASTIGLLFVPVACAQLMRLSAWLRRRRNA